MQSRTGMPTIIPLLYLLPCIILVEGFVSIAIEILTIRQLLPVAGGSVIVTSLIIGIFLLFLALGYARGGQITTGLHRVLRRNFFMVGLWCGVGLSYIFITVFFGLVEHVSGPHVIYPLMGYLVVILAPAIYLLGQTLPITMNIVRQDHAAGAIAAKTLGLSTIGSFLGAVFTSLVLMHFFGVAWTVFVVFMLLMLLSMLLSQTVAACLQTLVLGIAAGFFIYHLNIGIENHLFVLTNNYANYQVLNSSNSKLKDSQKILVINETYSSYHDKNNDAFAYIKELRSRIFGDLQLRGADILVLGAGGFTLSAGDSGGNHFTYVDIDKRIKQVVEANFLDHIKDKLVTDDARSYLNSTDKKFSVIVVDVFSDYKAMPAHLLTREFMASVHEHLLPDGYAMFNVIANPKFNDPYSRRIDNTIRSAFGSCAAIPAHLAKDATNIIYACSKSSSRDDHVVYVDNLNNSTTDAFTW